MTGHLLAIDQGTSGTKAVVVDDTSRAPLLVAWGTSAVGTPTMSPSASAHSGSSIWNITEPASSVAASGRTTVEMASSP